MKNKWKGSWLAKLGAWVGITISGSLFVGSVIGAVAIWDTGAYEMTAEEYQRDAMESAANQYAARALNNLVYLENYEISDTYFRYGIIQAEDIDGMNFNDESIYVERNFTEKVSQEDLFIVSHDVGNGDQYDMYVDAVLYNIEMGVFYYETSEGYFPVQEVKLGYTTNSGRVVYTLSYDYDVDMYRTHGAALLGMDGTVTQSYAETVDATVAEAVDDVVAEPIDGVVAEDATVAEPIDDAVAEDTTVAEAADEISEATDLGDLLYDAANSRSKMTRSLLRKPAMACTKHPFWCNACTTGSAMAQPTPPPITHTRSTPSISVGLPKGPTKSAIYSPSPFVASSIVDAPTAWNMMRTVPAARS